MFPHQNPLPKPEIIITPPFETLLSAIKTDLINYLTEQAPEDVEEVSKTLNNESEILTKFTEGFAVILQNYMRQANEQACQMFGAYATEEKMVDLIASQLDVERQVISPGDANAYPPIPPVMESNESLLTRYYLATFALASTGTREGYRFHAMTLGGRPTIKVDSPSPKKVVVTYEFIDNDFGGLTKDAKARRIARGEVDCFILSHSGNGVPTQELITATTEYLTREDIGQETDLITVKPASVSNWQCQAQLFIRPGPDTTVVQLAAEKAVREYAESQHRLGGAIEPSMLYNVLLNVGSAFRCELIQPAQPLRCAFSEAPYLESINITVNTENI